MGHHARNGDRDTFDVSVILPVYNEERMIDSVVSRIERYAQEHPGWEFVFVDDGSSDGTAERLEQLLAADKPQLRVLTMQENVGKGRALRAAVELCRGELICFTDGDLPYPLPHLDDLVEALGNSDVAIGSRKLTEGRQDNISLRRRISGGGFNWCVRAILSLPYHDTQAGIKGFRSAAARRLFGKMTSGGFAFDAELLFLAKRSGMSITEIPATVAKRHSYKDSSVDLTWDPFRMLISLLRVRSRAILGMYETADTAEPGRGGVRYPGGVREERPAVEPVHIVVRGPRAGVGSGRPARDRADVLHHG